MIVTHEGLFLKAQAQLNSIIDLVKPKFDSCSVENTRNSS
jgi:hypothetical protein